VLNHDSGGIDMPSLLPFLGHTELEVLSVVGVLTLVGTHLVTITSVKERILLASGYAQVLSSLPRKLIQELNEIWVNAWNLPPVIRQIVRVTTSLSANTPLMGTFLSFTVYNSIFVRIPPRLMNVPHDPPF
jgi:hypothetical protein